MSVCRHPFLKVGIMMLLRPFAALLLVGLCLLTALACGPASAPKPTPPAVVPPPPPLPDYAELHAIAQGLLDDLVRAFDTSDGALLAATLSREITELCSADELQAWAEEGGDDAGAVEAVEVFVNLSDYRRTLLEIHTPESELAGAINIPMPMELEGGGWRVKVPLFGVLPGECPFIPRGVVLDDDAGPYPEFSPPTLGPPEIPGLPDRGGQMFQPAPPGMTNQGSSSGSSSNADGLLFFESSGDLQGARTAAEIIGHYRAQWVRPEWMALDEQSADGVARLNWIARDADNRLWRGLLAVARLDDAMYRIWLSLQLSGEGADKPPFYRRDELPPPTASPPG